VIPPEAFNHGLTRNIAVERTHGDLVVLIVQDAVPASDTWLAELTLPLRRDESFAGTFARQMPRPDAGPITREYLARASVAAAESRTLEPFTWDEMARLDPMSRLRCCEFDNVCSCIRRSVWNQIPFRETTIGEDIEWAREVLLAGHRLLFVPSAVVLHSHDRSPAAEFARTYALHRRLNELFELRTIPTLALLIRAIASSVVMHWRCERSARSLGLAAAWPLGQYLGGLMSKGGRGTQP
jgi:rhamnosyltransferase